MTLTRLEATGPLLGGSTELEQEVPERFPRGPVLNHMTPESTRLGVILVSLAQ